MGGVTRATTIRVRDGEMERLTEIAAEHRALERLGGNPPAPSVSKLMRMIASGELVVRRESR